MWDGEKEIVHGFGWNKAGQLGLGDTIKHDMPSSIDVFNKKPVPMVACGSRHTVVYVDSPEEEKLYVFGRNAAGQLGIDKQSSDAAKVSAACHFPYALPFFYRRVVTHLACGSAHTVVSTYDELWAFGMNNEGQLGLGHSKSMQTPAQVNSMPSGLSGYNSNKNSLSDSDDDDCEYEHLCGTNIIPGGLGCGTYHTVVATSSGEVWAWGSNRFGQLGVGDMEKRYREAYFNTNNERHACQF
jgi:alpha-tubulin suppressor-like RCC1 family protein